MKLRFYLSILIGRLIYFIMNLFSLNATTFPGKVAYYICPSFLINMRRYFKKVIFITGTNGKTTTTNLIYQILKRTNSKVLANLEGANLRSGIITAFLKNPSSYDFGVFEVDEGIFPYVFRELKPDFIVITNFFRDQLDRYGEIDKTVNAIGNVLKDYDKTVLILNADDPFVARFSRLSNKKYFFGINVKLKEEKEEIRESIYCPFCGQKLQYEYFNYAQMGKYSCNCGFRNPPYDFYITSAKYENNKWIFEVKGENISIDLSFNYPGIYSLYNALAGFALAKTLGIQTDIIKEGIENFSFQLGRWEAYSYKGYKKILILVKNPAGYNQVLDSIIQDSEEKILLLILNDNIADGRDISWIWDVDFEMLCNDHHIKKIICSGKRGEELLLRLKYAEFPLEKLELINDISKSLKLSIHTPQKVYILPTYTALFYSRKFLKRSIKDGN